MENSALNLEETEKLNTTLTNFEKVLNETYKLMDDAGYSGEFIRSLKRTYTCFEFKNCKSRIDSDRWEKLINYIPFIECFEKEKIIKKYSYEYPYHKYSAPCYLENAERRLLQFERNKAKYIE